VDVAALTAFLVGFLVKTANHAADDLGIQLWERIKRAFTGNAAAEQAVRDATEHPDNPRALGSLEWQLEQLLAADGELAAEIEALWAQRPSVVAGERGVAAGGDISGSTIVTGDDNTLQR
jgi:hypothetical protein